MDVANYFWKIRSILKDVNLYLNFYSLQYQQWNNMAIVLRHLLPLFNGIHSIEMCGSGFGNSLNWFFDQEFFREMLPNIQMLLFAMDFKLDNATLPSMLQWLNTHSNQPRLVVIEYGDQSSADICTAIREVYFFFHNFILNMIFRIFLKPKFHPILRYLFIALYQNINMMCSNWKMALQKNIWFVVLCQMVFSILLFRFKFIFKIFVIFIFQIF